MKEKNKKMMWALLSVAEVCVLVGITLTAVLPFSCKLSTQGIQLLEGDYVSPKLDSYCVVDGKTVELVFSEQVLVSGVVVSPFVEGVSDSEEHSEDEALSKALGAASGENGVIPVEVLHDEQNDNLIRVVLEQETAIGEDYELYGVVEDLHGNTLTFAIVFSGFNSRVPGVIMTEIQTDMVSKNSAEKLDGTRRAEFVEILALSDGNLSGLEICSATYGEEKAFVFPAIEVSKGEIVVVHMRTYGEGCISETGSDLSLADGLYTNENVRDLWSANESKCFGAKNDVIVLRNSATDEIIDAFMFKESGAGVYDGVKLDYAVGVVETGIYKNYVDAVTVSDAKTASLTYSRVNSYDLYERALLGEKIVLPIQVDAESWICNSKASPGVIAE